MLPSTGYFKTINCPFYDSGLCERPYCHFRHVKKELTDTPSSSMCQANANNPAQECSTANTGDVAGTDILQRLVSEAVKKVLQHPEMLAGSVSSASENSIPQALVSQVVQELKPSALQIGGGDPVSEAPAPRSHRAYLPPAGVPSYKPTPISELKKRHIPVPYTPSPAPRGSSKVQVKRSGPSDDNSTQKKVKCDAKDIRKVEEEYNPESDVSVKDVAYNPSSLKYSPPHNGWSGSTKLPSYIPSSIDMLPKCNDDYVPSPVSSSVPLQQYCPTEKSCSRSEPNYVPEGSTNNISEILYTPTIKSELRDDIVDIDFSPEFDLLDEILNENSNESQKGNSMKTEDGPMLQSVVNSDEPKLNVENEKPKIDTNEKVDPGEVSSRSRHKGKLGAHVHVNSHSEPEMCSSVSKKEELKRMSRSKNKRHSSEKTKEQDCKRHDRVKHSNSNRSEHRKSVDKCSKRERGERTEKKDTGGDSKSQKHHKVKEESRTKDRHTHHSVNQHEKRSSSKTLVKGKSHSGNSGSKHESQGHHHHRHYRHKHTLEKHHQDSKSRRREHKTAAVTATRKVTKKHPGEDCGMNEGSEENYNSSSDTDTKDTEVVNSVALPDYPAAGLVSGSESDEDAITRECYRIFQEYEPQQSHHTVSKKAIKIEEPVKEEDIPVKKRIAHEAAQKYPPLVASSPKKQINPMHVMSMRISKMQELQERRATENAGISVSTVNSGSTTSTSMSSSSSVGSGHSSGPLRRVRIAHVPNVLHLLNAKVRMQAAFEKRKQSDAASVPTSKSAFLPNESTESHTVVQTVPKGGHRVAHRPSMAALTQPKIIGELGGKIPANVRQSYLNHLVAEYLKLCPNPSDAYSKATEEEAVIYSRSTTRSVYASHMSNKINRLRKEATTEANTNQPSTSALHQPRVLSHSAILAGHSATKGSWSIKRHTKTQGSKLSTEPLYVLLTPHILTEELLCSNGFPRPHPEEKGVAIVHLPPGTVKKTPLSPDRKRVLRVCCRCNQAYSVNRDGFQVKEEQCIYHWGRLFQTRVLGGWERRYTCCSSDGESGGCTVASCHVCDGFDPDELRGFVKTLPHNLEPADGDYGVYALDCEMCYTTVGLELTRVTVIDRDLNTAYESLVKPENPIIDYNTRFSGITEDDMIGVQTSIYDVQATLLSFIHERTILIGHSLDSDFKALKIIHSTVIDTSVVFPHKMGPPKKRALKTLCREHLNKIIQESVDGHDSAEDAKACMELMRWKVREA
ncbi:hypothetical protein B7P43_G03609 [Cryptotermes secundus]|uniref:C3H1-type domain-containing protein n=1 Tax=Cryptotermes secundus TaxID=105785 RepID=A0A2J7PSX5_9NEOP|nr:hypothetical protein B7P43_G03609 [Cryptotermes secundus]